MSWHTSPPRVKRLSVVKRLRLCFPQTLSRRERRRDCCFHHLNGYGGVSIAVCLGILIGVTAGWYSGIWDEILMRLMDGLSAFPSLLLALALVAITGGTVVNIILVVGVVGTPWVAR